MNDKRRVQIRKGGDNWVDILFKDITILETFRVFEPTGELVDVDGNTNFIATSNPYKNNKGVLTIKIVLE